MSGGRSVGATSLRSATYFEQERRLLDQTLTNLQARDRPTSADSVRAVGEANLLELERLIGDALAGRPVFFTVRNPDGSTSDIPLDSAAVERMESLLVAGVQRSSPTWGIHAREPAAKSSGRVVAYQCQVSEDC